jgi:hypothetical protein
MNPTNEPTRRPNPLDPGPQYDLDQELRLKRILAENPEIPSPSPELDESEQEVIEILHRIKDLADKIASIRLSLEEQTALQALVIALIFTRIGKAHLFKWLVLGMAFVVLSNVICYLGYLGSWLYWQAQIATYP